MELSTMCLPSVIWLMYFFFSSRRRHTRYWRDWSSDVCSSDLVSESSIQVLRIGPGQVHQEPRDLLAHRVHVLASLLGRGGRGIPDSRIVRHLAPLARRPRPALP